MKILIISDAWHPQLNGVVRTYEHIVQELEAMGHKVYVIGPANFRYSFPLPGYSEIKLVLWPYPRLKKRIKRIEPDYIHIATEGPLGWAARAYCINHEQLFTTSYHTHFPDYAAKRFSRYLPFFYEPIHKLSKAFIRHFHAPAQSMLIATQSLEDELKSWDFKTPMRRLSRGVKLDLFYPGPKTLFQNMEGPVALYVGRVAIEKNLEAFLEMEWPGSKVIVGDGPARAELTKAYPEAHFVGKKVGQELAEHYRSADVFVFPSKTDTFGIVLIEALACGLPVAGYKVTGPKDIITAPELGALAKDDLSGDNLAEAAQKCLSCGTAQERAAHVKTHYSWAATAKQFEKALTEDD